MSLVAAAAEARRYDDESLIHVANKGLLRRAAKLATPEPAISEDSSGAVTVAGVDWSVEFGPDTPLVQGRCDCSTNGVCQHLIAAIVSLRDADLGATPAADGDDDAGGASGLAADLDVDSIEKTLLALSDDALTAIGTRTELRWALERVVSLDTALLTIRRGTSLAVDLPTPHGSVRFLGPDPAGAVVKPSTRHDRRVVLLAVLALRLDAGLEPPRLESTSNRPVNELPAERLAVVRRAGELCLTLVRVGLLHLGDGEREQLDSLAASARGAKLYRLSVLAERASDQLAALQDRSPEGDTRTLFGQVAEIWTVGESIERALTSGRPIPVGLAGEARSRYETVGRLDLAAVGDYSWGDARFAGSTGVLMESAHRTYTVARPHRVGGRQLQTSVGWTGVGSVAALTGRRVTLFSAQASSDLKLSSSPSVTAETGPALTATDFDSLSWDGSPPESGSRLLGRPGAGWRVCPVDDQDDATRFDPIGQRLEWSIRSRGHRVDLTVPHLSGGSRIIENLERLAPTGAISHVVGRLRVKGGAMTLWPVSVFTDEVVALDRVPSETKPQRGMLASMLGSVGAGFTPTGRGDAATADHGLDQPPDAAERLLAQLIRLAERGGHPSSESDLEQWAARARSWGLGVLSAVVDSSDTPAEAQLRACWTLALLADVRGVEAPVDV